MVQDYMLPNNVVATTSSVQAIQGAQYAIHAVPVQHSRAFLKSIAVGFHPAIGFQAGYCGLSAL